MKMTVFQKNHSFFSPLIHFLFKDPISDEELLEVAYEAGLAEHNRVRALHRDTPPLVQSLKATVDAQAYADFLVSDWKGLKHSHGSSRPGQGENLARCGGSSPAAACVKATKMWYSEIKNYDFTNMGNHVGTVGHFVQVSVDKTSR